MDYNLVYLSSASSPFSAADLMSLLNQSRTSNLAVGITGLLLYSQGNFMQVLEGAKSDIDELMKKIRKDVRHYNVNVLEEGPIEKRQFPGWSMAFIDFASAEIRALPGYSPFLDNHLLAADLTNAPARSIELLHFFKAVMTASDSSLLSMASQAEKKSRAQSQVRMN